MRPRFRQGARPTSCARCALPVDIGDACGWCGHDPGDPLAVAALAERRAEALRLRRDHAARRAWLSAVGRPAFESCPACRQRTTTGLCEHCNFDGTDAGAVGAIGRYRDALAVRRDARGAAGERRRQRLTRLRARIAPPSVRRPISAPAANAPGCRPVAGDPAEPPASRPATARFMTCPSCRQWSSAPVCDWCDFDTTDHASVAHLVEEHRFARRRGQARRARAYATVRGLVRLDLGEQAHLLRDLAKWLVLGSVVGALAGLASAGFLESLAWATDLREAHPWLLFLLPVAGLVVGLTYSGLGGRAAQGNNLIIDEIHEPQAWVPRRMAPLVFVATVVTHVFGGSAGREGTAIQMSGSLTDGFSRVARVARIDRRLLLIAAIGGGFGAVFGVPLAGCIFALEVQAVGRMRYDALVPALTASVVGNQVVHGLGVHHTPLPIVAGIDLTAGLVARIVLAGVAFGATALLFAELTHGIKRAFAATVRWSPLRPFIGGLLVVALTFLVGSRDYLGLSIPLITRSLAGGVGVIAAAFALKLLFTAVTLGSGFQGGEVTPLFVIGATLGATLGHALGAPVSLFAALGFVAVFAGATNTPIACTIMGVELFGAGAIVPLAVACVVAYLFSAHRGIYGTQRVDTPKAAGLELGAGEGEVLTLHNLSRRRRLWLPPIGPGPAATADDGGRDDDDPVIEADA